MKFTRSLLAVSLLASSLPALAEDCLSFDPRTTKVSYIRGNYTIVDGDHAMFAFGHKRQEAYQALRIIKANRLNKSCFVGRPGPSMTYLLRGHSAPTQNLRGEDCVSFNPGRVKVVNINGRFKIVEGGHWISDFGQKGGEAHQALRIIKRYQFSKQCFVGRPGPSFTYWKK